MPYLVTSSVYKRIEIKAYALPRVVVRYLRKAKAV